MWVDINMSANRRKLNLSKLYDKKYVKKYLEEKGCRLISEYSGPHSKIDVLCGCGRIFTTRFHTILKEKTKCDVCTGRHMDYRYVKEFVESFGCELISTEYINSNTKIDIKCECGNIFQTTFGKFKNRNKRKCNKCSIGRKNNDRLTLEEVNDFLSKNQLVSISDYVNSSSPITVRCRCGRNYTTNFNKIKNGGRIVCPACTKGRSKIEVIVKDYLERISVDYLEQYKFKDLKSKPNVYYRFDFAIMDKGKVLCLIELDGEQHYKPIDRWGGAEYLKNIKENDSVKEKYCIDHNIKLFRMPYYKFNKIYDEINKILKHVNPVSSDEDATTIP